MRYHQKFLLCNDQGRIGFFSGGGCHVELERRRRKDRSAVGAEGVGSGEGVSPLPRKFLHFLFQNGEFLCTPAWISVWYFLPFRVMPLAVTNQII